MRQYLKLNRNLREALGIKSQDAYFRVYRMNGLASFGNPNGDTQGFQYRFGPKELVSIANKYNIQPLIAGTEITE